MTHAPLAAYRDAAFLAFCSPQEAVAWLESRQMHLSSVMGTPDTPKDSHILEYILLRRRQAAIDLALAQHGRSGTVLHRLYMRTSASVRVVACSNASLFVGDTFGQFWRKESLIWGHHVQRPDPRGPRALRKSAPIFWRIYRHD